MSALALSDEDFAGVREFFFRASGIRLTEAKRTLVYGRLFKRLAAHGLSSFRDYLSLLARGNTAARTEAEIAVDLLTTHETHFFRESVQFRVLRDELARAQPRDRCVRVWSAACSSGEEPASLAMTLADSLGSRPWQIVASDLSEQSLRTARSGVYPISRRGEIPAASFARHCQPGSPDSQSFTLSRALRDRIAYHRVNLVERAPAWQPFDAIFLRNVLFYFEPAMRERVVASVVGQLRVGGTLYVGQAESLAGLHPALAQVAPNVYRRIA